jgi:hypothetical protein
MIGTNQRWQETHAAHTLKTPSSTHANLWKTSQIKSRMLQKSPYLPGGQAAAHNPKSRRQTSIFYTLVAGRFSGSSNEWGWHLEDKTKASSKFQPYHQP